MNAPAVLVLAETLRGIESLVETLEAGGLRVLFPAGDDPAAVETGEHAADVLLLFHSSPAVCQRIRSSGNGHLPVLFVGPASELEAALAAGATDVALATAPPEEILLRLRHAAGRVEPHPSSDAATLCAERLQAIKVAVDAVPFGITISDAAGKIFYTNPAEARMHGYSLEELHNLDAALLGHPERRRGSPPPGLPIGPWTRESVNLRRNGEEFPVRLSSVPLHDIGGRYLGLATVSEDISVAKEIEAQMYRMAYHDPLTSLPNRKMFLHRLGRAIADAGEQGSRVGLLFLDLDNFKDINDAHGHDFGDKLLCEVASRLASTLRESDSLARLGGDEFVVILDGVETRDAAASAALRILESLSAPFIINEETVYTGGSIGIAFFPDDGDDTDAIYRCADTAMYAAKKGTFGGYCFFNSEMNEKVRRKVALERGLREALEKERFSLAFQPLWSGVHGGITGMEALIRWQDPHLGSVPPVDFIPVAERCGIIHRLGIWGLRNACTEAAHWLNNGNCAKIAVNVSVQQLKHPDFIATVIESTGEAGLDPAQVELEFTESVLMARSRKIFNTLLRLREAGFQLAIDDFGTGYSSMSYLRDFPVTRLKIDRSFVAGICRNPRDAAVVDAIVSLAANLGLKVTLEGVETEEQFAFARQGMFDEIQGFHLSPPVSPLEARQLITGENVRWGREIGGPAAAYLFSGG